VSADLILLGAVVYLAIGSVVALLVYLVDRGDGREYARTLDQWWTPILYVALILLWPPVVIVLGVGVLLGGFS
jgi:hypothetical protein